MKENQLQVLKQTELLGQQFSVYGTPEEPLFLADDVAKWIEHSNATEMLRKVDEDEKLTSLILRAGQSRACNFLTENGLYEVLMQSRKPIAKQFKRGVKLILRDVRRHGVYATPQTIDNLLADHDNAIRLFQTLKEERQKRVQAERTIERQKQTIERQAPKVAYVDEVLSSQSTFTATEIAAVYGKSAKWLNKILHALGIQYKLGSMWHLYERYKSKGLARPRICAYAATDCHSNTREQMEWTEKGRRFIHELLTSKNLVPGKEVAS